MFVDTNVLVAARFATAPTHRIARACLQRASEDRKAALCISRQVIREYLATVTRPQSWSEPLAMAEALGDVSRLTTYFDSPGGRTPGDGHFDVPVLAPCRWQAARSMTPTSWPPCWRMASGGC